MEGSSWSTIKSLPFQNDEAEKILFEYPNADIEFEEALGEEGIPWEKLAWAADTGQSESDAKTLSKNISNLVSHMTSLRKGLRLLAKHNEKTPFDFVILSRYDAVVLKFPNIVNLKESKLYLSRDHERFPDFIIAGAVEKILALDGLDLLFEEEADKELLIAENLKSKSFHRFFNSNDVATISAISRPLRNGGRFTSIINLLAALGYSSVLGLFSRFRKKYLSSS